MTSIQIDVNDGLSSSVAIKGPCKVATTANITLIGKQTIDGVAVVTGDRVLVKSQTAASDNGIWICDTGNWRRSKDFNKTKDVKTGTMVNVTSGTAGAGQWQVSTADPITIGTTSIAFTQAGFLQTGTSAVTRTWQAKGGDTISVKDFGAVGNGSTDDTTAIQAAIAAVGAAGGGVVYFPQGTYKVSSALTITSNNVLLDGAGLRGTQVLTNSTTANVFVFGTGTVASVSGVGVRNMLIGSSVTKTAGAGVTFDGVYQAVAADLVVSSMNRCITVSGSSKIVFLERLYIPDPVPTTGRGIYITGNSNDVYMSNLLIVGTTGAQPESGICLDNCNGIFAYNAGVFQGGNALYIIPGTSQLCENLFFVNCPYDTSVNGISIAPTSTGAVRRAQFTACWSASNSTYGVNVAGGAATIDDIEFLGFRAYANGQYGILVSNAINVSLDACTVSGNSSSSSGTYHGIGFGTGATKFRIRNCRSGQVGNQGNTQGYGCVITDAAADNFVVTSNDFQGNVTGAMLVSAGTSATKVIKDCLGYINQAKGAVTDTTDASGDLTITHGMSVTPTVVIISRSLALSTGEAQPHTIGSTTFKIRFWNSAGSADASVSRSAMWEAIGPNALN